MNNVLAKAKEFYALSPCRCKRCGQHLPFYHHRDHICQTCLEAEIDADFDAVDFHAKGGFNGQETPTTENRS